jgi:hypothetical protein
MLFMLGVEKMKGWMLRGMRKRVDIGKEIN